MRWGCIQIATNGKKEIEINEAIRDREVRLIDADGTQLGVVSGREALRLAQEKDLDLVKIAPQAQQPGCKILDYGKYRFEQQKREKEAKKNQKVIEIKEIRLSLNIDTNDFNTKVNQAEKFLKAGHKIKVSIRFRGREMAHTNLGLEVQKRFAEALPDAQVDKPPKLEGRSMQMFMSPKPGAQK
ncbi:MAG TPA: translation initiation factor IF-3 [Candidatus Fournierella merdigallinarum]|nr:translation initiation factor IF-3 [Candidatus Fournierella merdigallinarum]